MQFGDSTVVTGTPSAGLILRLIEGLCLRKYFFSFFGGAIKPLKKTCYPIKLLGVALQGITELTVKAAFLRGLHVFHELKSSRFMFFFNSFSQQSFRWPKNDDRKQKHY